MNLSCSNLYDSHVLFNHLQLEGIELHRGVNCNVLAF